MASSALWLFASNATPATSQVITNFRTVRSFAAEEKEVNRFESALQGILSVGYAKALAQGLSLGLVTGWFVALSLCRSHLCD